MMEDECGEVCCNHGCNQGRNCPARQACEIPEVTSNLSMVWDWVFGLFASIGIFTAIVAFCLWIGHKQ